MATTTPKTATLTSTDIEPPQEQPSEVREEPPRKPYRVLWNPNLPWLDLLICFIFRCILPFYKLAPYPPDSEEAHKINGELRTKFDKATEKPFQQGCRKWSKACDGGLVQCTVKVPQRPSLLYEWGIIDKDDELMKQAMEQSSGNVSVHVWCPASLVLKEGDERKENKCGCVEADTINIKDIPHDVPCVLWFHGGGLTAGSFEFGVIDEFIPLLEKQQQVSKADSFPPLLVASVEYRLAPDHPLPAAAIDALSVVDYFLKDDPDRKIHVSGASAGAYLSLISAFAGHRHYPGRIESALVMIPFISPAADSMSYYMNGPSSVFISVAWLRWCWRAALGMTDNVDEDGDDVLASGSNRTAWNKSKWKQNEQWHKFLEPLEGLPPGLDDKENGIKYIVAVNKADPLYDEGKELSRKLELNGAEVEYVEAKGSHAVGYVVDKRAMAEMIEKWRSAVFGTGARN